MTLNHLVIGIEVEDVLLIECSFWQPRHPVDMAPPTHIKQSGPWISETPSCANVGVQLISKCRHRHGLNGWVGLGWWMRKSRVKQVLWMDPEWGTVRFTGINVEE